MQGCRVLPSSTRGEGRNNKQSRCREEDVTSPLLIEHSDGLDRVTLNEGISDFLEKRKPVYIRR
jgi:hypothetical protein